MIIRTRYFDEFLQRAAQEQGIRQIVLLAAGLDTRAYRLKWPTATRLFELDQPAVLQYKAEVLQTAGALPTCERKAIPADLTAAWGQQLTAQGFDTAQPAAWLLEGFLFYLPEASITRILDEISSLAAPGSWLGFDIVNSLTLTSPITQAWVGMQAKMGAPWVGTMDDPEAFLEERGWKASLTQPGSPDANYGRWTLPVIPVKLAGLPHNWYVSAIKE
jgi:methyltransferase (TIGR00027 family)